MPLGYMKIAAAGRQRPMMWKAVLSYAHGRSLKRPSFRSIFP